MIVKPFAGSFPDLEVTISDVPVDYASLNAIEVTLSENMHDMLVFEMAGIPTRLVTAYINSAVKVVLSLGNTGFTFAGRVIDVMPVAVTSGGLVNHSPYQTGRIVCLGNSYEMRGGGKKVWTDYTLADIVRDFSEKYKFSADLPTAKLRQSLKVQEAESDWQFLVKEVEANALVATMHGTHLHIFDPYSALSRQRTFTTLTTLRRTKMDAVAYSGQILEFKPRFGERNADGIYKETSVDVVSKGGSLLYTLSSGDGNARFQQRIDGFGSSYEEATKLAEAARRRAYDYEATAQVVGTLSTVPGSVVKVDTYDNADIDGYWYVREVHHRVATGAFITDLTLARNRDNNLVLDGTSPMLLPPAPLHLNGRWEASRRVVREY